MKSLNLNSTLVWASGWILAYALALYVLLDRRWHEKENSQDWQDNPAWHREMVEHDRGFSEGLKACSKESR